MGSPHVQPFILFRSWSGGEHTMQENLRIDVPSLCISIKPGNVVRLGRFDSTMWVVSHGWFTWGGNRPQCGWFLTDVSNPAVVKPLQLPDLDDIYLVES